LAKIVEDWNNFTEGTGKYKHVSIPAATASSHSTTQTRLPKRRTADAPCRSRRWDN